MAPDRTDRTEPTGPTGPTGPTRLDRRTGPWPGPRPGPVPPLDIVIRIHPLELIKFTLQAKEIRFHSQTSARLGTSERCVLQRWNDGQQSPTSFPRSGIDALPGNFTPFDSRFRPHLQQTGTYIGISRRRISHFFAILRIITIRYQTCQRLLRIGQAASKQWLGSSNRIGKYIVPERRKLSSYHCKCVVGSSDYQNFRLRGRAETK